MTFDLLNQSITLILIGAVTVSRQINSKYLLAICETFNYWYILSPNNFCGNGGRVHCPKGGCKPGHVIIILELYCPLLTL